MHRVKLLLGLLLTLLAVACAQKSPIRDVLQQKGRSHFLALAQVAGITEPAPSALLTIFAPTNQAIDTFLKSMKLSLDDMKGRPGLSAAVVGYHVLPRIKGRIADVQGASKAAPLEAITADGDHFLRFYMGPADKVVLEDVQNNTATVTAAGTEVGNVMIYPIDKVMLSGDVFTSLDSLLSMHPQFRPLRSIYNKAGLEDEVQAMQGDRNSLTIFAPTAEAVRSAEPQLASLSRSQLQDVLRYHIVPAALPIPAGLQADKPYPTAFKGHTLKFKYNQVAPASGKASGNTTAPHASQRQLGQTVEIVPEAGTFADKKVAGVTVPKVTLANLFANRMVIHGISQVLKPNLPAPAAPTAKPSTAPAAASKTPQSTALPPPPPAAAAAAASPGSKGASGRKLMQFRAGTGPSVMSNSLTAAQNSIRAAVAGNTNVDEATAVGEVTAVAATRRCWNCILDSGRK